MTTKARPKINALDLTVDQIEQIESSSGIPLDEWPRTKQRLKLFRWIYGIATDTPDELVGRMTLRDLTDTVTMDEDGRCGPYLTASSEWCASTALTLGWTMREVRRHTLRDIQSMMDAIADRRKAQERAQRRAAAHKLARAQR